MDVFAIQTALKSQGFEPGAIDGIWGRSTRAALRAFQHRNGLDADGIFGPQTEKRIFAHAAAPPQPNPPLWVAEARRLRGTREVAGKASNRDILDWAHDLDIAYSGDDVPWCGLFVAHCVGSTLPEEPLPTNPLGARNWLTFGAPCQPVWGAVLVFWRGSRSGWSGHVGFYEGEDGAAYHVLGGNQSDSVSTARIGKDRLLGARWPASGGKFRSAAAMSTGGGLSTNEQ